MDTLKVAIFHALTGPAGVDMPGDRALVRRHLALELSQVEVVAPGADPSVAQLDGAHHRELDPLPGDEEAIRSFGEPDAVGALGDLVDSTFRAWAELLARKLLVALWRYLETGVLPERA